MFGIFSPSSLEWVFLVALWFLACAFLLCGKLSTCLLCSWCTGTVGIFSMGVVWGCKFMALAFWEGGGAGSMLSQRAFQQNAFRMAETASKYAMHYLTFNQVIEANSNY